MPAVARFFPDYSSHAGGRCWPSATRHLVWDPALGSALGGRGPSAPARLAAIGDVATLGGRAPEGVGQHRLCRCPGFRRPGARVVPATHRNTPSHPGRPDHTTVFRGLAVASAAADRRGEWSRDGGSLLHLGPTQERGSGPDLGAAARGRGAAYVALGRLLRGGGPLQRVPRRSGRGPRLCGIRVGTFWLSNDRECRDDRGHAAHASVRSD